MIKYYEIMKLNILDNDKGYVIETEDLIDFYIDKVNDIFMIDNTGIRKKTNKEIIISEEADCFCLRNSNYRLKLGEVNIKQYIDLYNQHKLIDTEYDIEFGCELYEI